MNTFATSPDAHLADDELLRFIDGESDFRQAAWQAHVRDCERCAQEVELLRGNALAVTEWLERAAFEEPETGGPAEVIDIRSGRRTAARSFIRPWMRVAAVLALLATPVAAMPALRQWIVQTIDDLRGGTAPVPPTMQHEVHTTTDLGAIRFEATGGTFVVHVEAHQATGTLHVTTGETGEALLQMSGAGTEPVVSAAALRLRNAGSAASYTLQLPPRVQQVEVRLPGDRSVILDTAALQRGRDINLRR